MSTFQVSTVISFPGLVVKAHDVLEKLAQEKVWKSYYFTFSGGWGNAQKRKSDL